MGWLSSNKKRAFTEKLMKDIRAREEEENIDVIGKISPEMQQQRTAENTKAKSSKKMQNIREEREVKDKATEDQLIVIHGAKIKFNAHLGEFKVLSDVPTTQDKLTGTIVEKQITNFTFLDGFQLTSLTEYEDFGNLKFNENEAILKKSTIEGVGVMSGSGSPENGKIEFLDSGQVHVPESIDTKGAPLPDEKEDETEYIYYTKEGLYLGGNESSSKVFLSTQVEYNKIKPNKKWGTINKKDQLLKLFDVELNHFDFLRYAGIVNGEATNSNATTIGISEAELKKERFAFGNMIYNYMKESSKKTLGSIPKNYSYAYKDESPAYKFITKSKPESREDKWICVAFHSVINAIQELSDYSNGASYWDGGDVFTANSASNYDPMKHFRQKQQSSDNRLKGIYDKNGLAKNMYKNLKKYYTKFDTHRFAHLKKELFTYDKIYYAGDVVLISEDGSGKLVDTNGKIIASYNRGNTILKSIGTGVFEVEFKCLWEVREQAACSIFYKELKYN